MKNQAYEVRYRSEMTGGMALHSQHATREAALAASNEFHAHVRNTSMDQRSKAQLMGSIRVGRKDDES